MAFKRACLLACRIVLQEQVHAHTRRSAFSELLGVVDLAAAAPCQQLTSLRDFHCSSPLHEASKSTERKVMLTVVYEGITTDPHMFGYNIADPWTRRQETRLLCLPVCACVHASLLRVDL